MPEKLTKPRLKQGETPNSPSYLGRLALWQRQEALAEATKAQAEQTASEAATRAQRDVLAETAAKPAAPAAPATGLDVVQSIIPEIVGAAIGAPAPATGVASSGINALSGREAQLQQAIEGGIAQADADNQRKKK